MALKAKKRKAKKKEVRKNLKEKFESGVQVGREAGNAEGRQEAEQEAEATVAHVVAIKTKAAKLVLEREQEEQLKAKTASAKREATRAAQARVKSQLESKDFVAQRSTGKLRAQLAVVTKQVPLPRRAPQLRARIARVSNTASNAPPPASCLQKKTCEDGLEKETKAHRTTKKKVRRSDRPPSLHESCSRAAVCCLRKC